MLRRLKYIDKTKLYIIFFIFIFLFSGIGYAYLNSNLGMHGDIVVRTKANIRVTDYKYKSSANGGEDISNRYKTTELLTNFRLPNLNSTVTYDVEITNKDTLAMLIKSITEELENNQNITFELSNLSLNNTVLMGNNTVYNFQITFKYKQTVSTLPQTTTFNSKLNLEFVEKECILAGGSYNNNLVFNKSMAKSSIESIEFVDNVDVPEEVEEGNSWDASASKDGSVIAWILDEDENNLYELYIGGYGKIYGTNNSLAFYNYNKVTKIDFNNVYDTSKSTSMFRMFTSCSSLTSLDLSSFNTSNVTSMEQMFSTCSSLTSLNISNFNTENVTNMSNMFNGCKKLENLNVSNFNTEKVTNMSSMFNGCSNLTSLNLSNFNTKSVTSMGYMFTSCSSLTSLNLSNFNTSNVTSMDSMFLSCSKLISLNISSFNTEKVESMWRMFSSCSSLTSLDLSSFNTSNVTNMSKMFSFNSKLESLILGSFTNEKVTNMSDMFYNCTKLTTIDFSKFYTPAVTNMSQMFFSCSSLTSLDLSTFNTSNVTNMSYMFSGCTYLESLDLSSFNTEKVTDMSYMFGTSQANGSGVVISSLDLSSFNTSAVTNMTGMFRKSNIPDLDVRNLTFKPGVTTTNMFQNSASGMNIIVKSNDEKTTIEGLNATANVTIAPAPEPEGE